MNWAKDLDLIHSAGINTIQATPSLVQALIEVCEADAEFQDDLVPSVGVAKNKLEAIILNAETIISSAQSLLDILDEVE